MGDSNRNRQFLALSSTVGRRKTDVLEERLKDINPGIEFVGICEYLEPDNTAALLGGYKPDFLVDMEWKDGKLVSADILSTKGGPLKVKSGGAVKEFDTAPGQLVQLP